MSSAALSISAAPDAGTAPAQPPQRVMAGLVGILVAAIMAGLNNRVGALALADVRGALGFGLDDASWLGTAYNAGELIAMPFATWFAITLSIRRFQLWMLGTCTLLAMLMPLLQNLHLLLITRFLQGIASGTTIPLLMMAALKFLPPAIRLYGLALYAMTATFSPNLAIWLAGYWTDGLHDWRWVYWQIIPLAIAAGVLVAWGLPREPVQMGRFRQANWLGMVCGVPALGLLAIALDQGVRLDWFHSPLITFSLAAGLVMLMVWLLTEWYHPSPFIKLQILSRRNLGLGFTLFLFVLVVLMSSSLLPASYLVSVQNYRPYQMASIGLTVALPQLVLGFAVALLLYQRWIDARIVFAGGLCLIALACFSGTHLTSDWNREQFFSAQMLQAFGQPMAVVSMLFLITSVVQPFEGPYVAGTINTLRALGSSFGAAVVGQLVTIRGRFHAEMLLNHSALAENSPLFTPELSQLMTMISQESLVLAIADAYLALGMSSLLLIPIVMRLTYIPAPDLLASSRSSHSS